MLFWLTILLGILLIPIVVAPWETAGWWVRRRRARNNSSFPQPSKSTEYPTSLSGHSNPSLCPSPDPKNPEAPGPANRGKVRAQLVYFTGVAGYSGEFLARRERAFLDRLGERFPELLIHSDIFPYSVDNTPLNGERLFRKLWEFLHYWRQRVPNSIFDVLIVARNIGQLLVSADPRYGPLYNLGLSEQLQARLDPGLPTVFLTYSGGTQMATGALGRYWTPNMAPVHLVALGGVFSDDSAISHFRSVTQIVGAKDWWMPHVPRLLFPGRWKSLFWSAWNRYRRSGRYQQISCGPHHHTGARDYFSFKPSQPDGPRYCDLTFQALESRLQTIDIGLH